MEVSLRRYNRLNPWPLVVRSNHRNPSPPRRSVKESESCPVMSDSLWPHGLYSPWNSSGQNMGVGSLSLLRGIFLTQGSNPGLPHCRRILYQLRHKGSPIDAVIVNNITDASLPNLKIAFVIVRIMNILHVKLSAIEMLLLFRASARPVSRCFSLSRTKDSPEWTKNKWKRIYLQDYILNSTQKAGGANNS